MSESEVEEERVAFHRRAERKSIDFLLLSPSLSLFHPHSTKEVEMMKSACSAEKEALQCLSLSLSLRVCVSS